MVSASTLIGPFEFDRALGTLPLLTARSQASEESRRGEFSDKVSFFTSLSAAETHVFGVKFIGVYGTVVFIAIRDFSC